MTNKTRPAKRDMVGPAVGKERSLPAPPSSATGLEEAVTRPLPALYPPKREDALFHQLQSPWPRVSRPSIRAALEGGAGFRTARPDTFRHTGGSGLWASGLTRPRRECRQPIHLPRRERTESEQEYSGQAKGAAGSLRPPLQKASVLTDRLIPRRRRRPGPDPSPAPWRRRRDRRTRSRPSGRCRRDGSRPS